MSEELDIIVPYRCSESAAPVERGQGSVPSSVAYAQNNATAGQIAQEQIITSSDRPGYLSSDCPGIASPDRFDSASPGRFAGAPPACPDDVPAGRSGSTPSDCPEGCASCTQHLTRPCCVLLEVTTRCNLGCPVCYAASQTDGGSKTADPSLATIASWYEALYKRAGACNIQLSGGEPTMRDDLESIIELGRDAGFSYFQLNTNGVRLAEEPGLAKRLKAAGLTCVFLQFDGMSDSVHQLLRGRKLQATKEAAVDACVAAQLPCVLVPTVAGGVNEQELMPLIRYGISKGPTVRGIHIQPMAWFGRTDLSAERLTNAKVITALEEQSRGMIQARHFTGGQAEHPECSFNAHYFITDEGRLEPSGVQRPSCCDDTVEQARDVQARRWGTDLAAIAPERPPRGTMDEFLWQTRARSFAVTGMAFMDRSTLDLERLRRCYLFILDPKGTPIPFCAYNIAHRNGTRAGSPRARCERMATAEKDVEETAEAVFAAQKAVGEAAGEAGTLGSQQGKDRPND